ncbi:DUF6452 family protein [Bacteroidota bacterium]
MKRIQYLLILISIVFTQACESGEGICTTDVISRVNAGFYVRDSLGERDTLLNDFSFYGTLRPDSLIYDSVAGIKKILFPLPHSPEGYTSFIISTDTTTEIKIYHTPNLVLVSYECGFTVNHNIYWVSYNKTLIDTIAITDPWVNLTNEENLKIYLKPAVADTAN